MTIVIVNWNRKELLKKCLASIFDDKPPISYEVFVVDNGSIDSSAALVEEEFPQVHLIRNEENLGFSRANNQGMRKGRGRYILLLNNDIEVLLGALVKMIQFMDANPQAGAVGGKLFYPSMTHQVGFNLRRFPRLIDSIIEIFGMDKLWPTNPFTKRYWMLKEDFNKVLSVEQPAGACLLVRREVIEKVGLLDEGFFSWYEDVDWCLRIKKAGHDIFFLPQSKFIHHHGASFKRWESGYGQTVRFNSMFYYYRKNKSAASFLILKIAALINLLLRCLGLALALFWRRERSSTLSLVLSYLRICQGILTGKGALKELRD